MVSVNHIPQTIYLFTVSVTDRMSYKRNYTVFTPFTGLFHILKYIYVYTILTQIFLFIVYISCMYMFIFKCLPVYICVFRCICTWVHTHVSPEETSNIFPQVTTALVLKQHLSFTNLELSMAKLASKSQKLNVLHSSPDKEQQSQPFLHGFYRSNSKGKTFGMHVLFYSIV